MKLVNATVLLFLLLFLVIKQPVNAIYEPLSVANNKYGIHVFDAGELEKAAKLVNTSGGEWGYVTVPIRANERDLDKWTKFMVDARRLKLIPILRIASFPVDDHWMAPNEWDLVDFANFLNDLAWPTKNRYVMIYNEPNHTNEWGGFVYPEEYGRVLARAVDIFHQKNPDFFVISGGMDASAPNGHGTMDEFVYMRRMEEASPGVFKKIDGFSAHAYGNPGFSAFPNITSRVNVASYRFEVDFLKGFGVDKPKLFLTEAGWNAGGISDEIAAKFYQQAFTQIWTDDTIVAITPFVLEAHDGPFKGFSFVNDNGGWKAFAKTIQDLPKVAGKPQIAPEATGNRQQGREKIQQLSRIARPSYSFDELINRLIKFLGILNR